MIRRHRGGALPVLDAASAKLHQIWAWPRSGETAQQIGFGLRKVGAAPKFSGGAAKNRNAVVWHAICEIKNTNVNGARLHGRERAGHQPRSRQKRQIMFLDTVDQFASIAAVKTAFLKRTPVGFWLSAMMAGAYVGIGIILIFSVGSDVDPSYRALIMGASFGIALTLVVFAGSDLFTGHTMFMSLGLLRGRVRLSELGACWLYSWLGNLVGSAILAGLFVIGGGGAVLHSKSQFLMSVATAKMTAPEISLLARAILCNWLVCLALWMAGRMQGDAAKCI